MWIYSWLSILLLDFNFVLGYLNIYISQKEVMKLMGKKALNITITRFFDKMK